MSNAEMDIKLSANNSDAIVSIKQGGRVTQKCISVEDLTARLAQRHVMSTGILPSNTRYFKGDRNRYTIAIEAPAKVKRFLLYVSQQAYEQGEAYTPEELMVPFPNCIFVFKVDSRRVSSTWLYATERRIGLEADPLMYFPFGNVYEDGHICWGHGNIDTISSPMALAGVVSMFFDLPFNGDLFERRVFNSPGDRITDFFALVRHLAGQNTFPPNILRSAGKTFRDLLGQV